MWGIPLALLALACTDYRAVAENEARDYAQAAGMDMDEVSVHCVDEWSNWVSCSVFVPGEKPLALQCRHKNIGSGCRLAVGVFQ